MALKVLKQKTTIHHKKRLGAHHRRSKDFLKPYHPYLPLLILVVIGLAVNSMWASHIRVLGASSSLSATELLEDTNEERLKHNQDSLQLSNKLSSAAQAKANDMATKKYWSHTTPSGEKPWAFIKHSGYEYYSAGENLAYGFNSSTDTITGWMNSREHRANLLGTDFRDVGFGIATAEGFQGEDKTTIIVAMYGEPSLALGGVGFASSVSAVNSDIPVRTVSRIQLLTDGRTPWIATLVTIIALLAVVWFFTRHVKIWKRVLAESEEFVVRHKFLDILIVATAVAGFILTRSAGFIH